MGSETDNNNENANLLIIAYQYFSYLVLTVSTYHKKYR
ncbi:hypothetical protein FQV37_1568 [Psychrobacter nivimaris]|uniref:Uncharacterized protein n=1 Tax=Psychrobacter nivimaris TaxID=281738 RepID=A0A6N7C050_9GAMM|nr:hypothetical protein FQV37_1568 [Psychrobacter nivimaris]